MTDSLQPARGGLDITTPEAIDEILDRIREKHARISEQKTPRPFIKKRQAFSMMVS